MRSVLGSGSPGNRGYHSDWPHDLASLVNVDYEDAADRFADSGSGRPEQRRAWCRKTAVYLNRSKCAHAHDFKHGSAMAVNTLWVGGQSVSPYPQLLVVVAAQ